MAERRGDGLDHDPAAVSFDGVQTGARPISDFLVSQPLVPKAQDGSLRGRERQQHYRFHSGGGFHARSRLDMDTLHRQGFFPPIGQERGKFQVRGRQVYVATGEKG